MILSGFLYGCSCRLGEWAAGLLFDVYLHLAAEFISTRTVSTLSDL